MHIFHFSSAHLYPVFITESYRLAQLIVCLLFGLTSVWPCVGNLKATSTQPFKQAGHINVKTRKTNDTASHTITVSICPHCCTWFCLLVVEHQHAYFVVKRSVVQKIYDRQRTNENVNFTVTLTLNTAIQFLHKTLQNVRMYSSIKSGCKKKGRLV